MAFKNVTIRKQKFEEDEKVWTSMRKDDCMHFDIMPRFNYEGPAIIMEYDENMQTVDGRTTPYLVLFPETMMRMSLGESIERYKDEWGEFKYWVAPYVIKDSFGVEDE